MLIKGGGGGVGEHKFFRTSGPYIFSNIRVGGGGGGALPRSATVQR